MKAKKNGPSHKIARRFSKHRMSPPPEPKPARLVETQVKTQAETSSSLYPKEK